MSNPSNAEVFSFPLPIDPTRFVLGLLRRWFLILLATLVGAVLVLGLGSSSAEDTYLSAVELIGVAANSPHSQNTGGESVRAMDPYVQFGGAVLTSLASDPSVRQQVVERVGLTVDDVPDDSFTFQVPLSIHGMEVGVYTLATVSSNSDQEAYDLVTTWAEVLMEKVGAVQAEHATKDMERFSKLLVKRKAEAEAANKALQTFIDENEIREGTKSVESLYGKKTELEEELRDIDSRIGAEEQILVQVASDLSGGIQIRGELSKAEKDLEKMVEVDGMTEEHGRVRAARRSISMLSKKLTDLAKVSANAVDPVQVANAQNDFDRYATAVRARAERDRLMAKKVRFNNDLRLLRDRLESMTELSNRAEELRVSYESKAAAAAEIQTRVDNLVFLSDHTPAPIKILNSASLEQVNFYSKRNKLVKLTAVGAILGFVMGCGIALLREFTGRRLTTPLQAAISTSALPVASYPPPNFAEVEEHARSNWTKLVLGKLPGIRRLLFVSIGNPKQEQAYWQAIVNAGASRWRQLLIADFGETPLQLEVGGAPVQGYNSNQPAAVSIIPASVLGQADFQRFAANLPEHCVLLLRWSSSNIDDLSVLKPIIDEYYLVVDIQGDAHLVASGARNCRAILGNSSGVVTLEAKRPGWFSSRFYALQQSLAIGHMSKMAIVRSRSLENRF